MCVTVSVQLHQQLMNLDMLANLAFCAEEKVAVKINLQRNVPANFV